MCWVRESAGCLRGAQLFSQGSPQDGIFLIESGRIKVFYTAPSGREITLAYWHSGNFVGGPEVFKQGLHVWSGVAAVNSTVLHLPGDVLRRMVMTIPALAIRSSRASASRASAIPRWRKCWGRARRPSGLRNSCCI